MVLFSTFWLLFITSFVGTKIDTVDDAKIIYSNVMIVSVVFGLVLMPFLGKIVDVVNP
jgi:MFS-type transporter involved in bile tolerance (Atg22 family)